jgi:hypothetical protein
LSAGYRPDTRCDGYTGIILSYSDVTGFDRMVPVNRSRRRMKAYAETSWSPDPLNHQCEKGEIPKNAGFVTSSDETRSVPHIRDCVRDNDRGPLCRCADAKINALALIISVILGC